MLYKSITLDLLREKTIYSLVTFTKSPHPYGWVCDR